MLSQLACQQPSPFRATDVPLQDLGSHGLAPESEFPESSPLQLAVLWTKPEETGLGLLHSLRQMGIPFFWTHSLDQALKHPQMLLYPSVDGKTFTPEQPRDSADMWRMAGRFLLRTSSPDPLSPFLVSASSRPLAAVIG